MGSTRIRRSQAQKWTILLGCASVFTIATMLGAQAQQTPPAQTAQASPDQVPEQVLVTGSLIHGAAAVGVPVTSLSDQDFKQSGSLTIGDLFKNVPSVVVIASPNVINGGGYINRGQNINIRNLSQKGNRTLMLVDGMRFPNQGNGGCQTDPSIIPQLALDRLDVLADGASATYGSDAIAGVVNVILKRGYDGAITQFQVGGSPDIGHTSLSAAMLYGHTWDGGDITVSYEFYSQDHVDGTKRSYFTQNFFDAQGLDNRQNIINSRPGIVTVGAATTAAGTPAGFAANLGANCSNCFSIPKGQNGVGLTWASILANPGVANEVNVFSDSWAEPRQQRNAVTLTFDQRVTSDIQFFADGWYSNRRSTMITQALTNSFNVTVPTSNPYYPIGAPAGLRVNYDLALEVPDHVTAGETAGRFDMGFNVKLPFDWTGKVYAAVNQDGEYANTNGAVNTNMVNAAIGNTIAAVPATAVSPGIPAFTKPSNIPYLNLFCDPTAFRCNDPATLAMVSGFIKVDEKQILQEYGVNADGPLFDLPGGPVRAAFGANLIYNSYSNINTTTNSNNTQVINYFPDKANRQIYAAFAQLNVPVIGEGNKLPFVERLEIEGSIRYDHYNIFGGTTNPKVAVDWGVGYGLIFKGSWGTAFRAPSFQEATIASPTAINQLASAPANNVGTCPVVGVPAVPGSIAALIDPNCSAGLQFLGGLSLLNAAATAAPVRPAGFALKPERAQNLSGGFEFAPTEGPLKGLDVQGTYWFIKIRDKLQGYFGLNAISNGQLDDPNYAPAIITAVNNPNFASQVAAILSNPLSTIPISVAPNISFISDGAIRNIGWQSVDGVDFNVSYDLDLGDWGAWNTGVTGTYNIDNKSLLTGTSVISVYTTPVNGGIDSGGRLRYRARLGWADDSGWSVTGYMNFFPHFNSDTAALPPACFQIGNTACNASGLPQFAQYTKQYALLTNFIPGLYTFDLSIGYKTGNTPANDYLKNIGLQLIVNNVLNKQPPFQYSIAPPGNAAAHAFFTSTAGSELGIDGRFITFVVTKAW
jgi:iron complex outermembrane receptor protein